MGNYVYASTTPNPDFNTNSVVTIYVSDLVVADVEDTAVKTVTLAENGDITLNEEATEVYTAELWTLPETDKGGNWNRIWTGEYQYGNADKDINRDELVAGAYYYVVIDGVKSNTIHLVAPETAEISAD